MSMTAMVLTHDEEQKYLELAERADKSKVKSKPSLNVNSIILSSHAYEMMADRFRIKDKLVALETVRSWLYNATYICETVDENNSRTHLYGVFVKAGMAAAINVNLSYDKVVTVINMPLPQYPMPSVMRDKVFELYRSELRKLHAKEQRLINKTEYIEAEANAEIYPLRFKILKSSSENKKAEYRDRIKELQASVENHYASIKELQTKVRQIARSMITLL